ncbi:HTH domain-containing protein [Enterococcus plantarum]|nr:HTH domain-containing protein [Enterococcus plantarum]
MKKEIKQKQISEKWNVSERTVRRKFKDIKN